VIIRELGALYSALAAGRPVALPELPVQYADYAVWQRAWVSGPVLSRLLTYWRRRLAGELPVLRLPLEAGEAPATAPGGERQVLPLAPDLAAALAELARREGCTLFMALLAGFQALLHRVTGETDVAVGTAVAGRDRGEVEGLVGFFVNMIVLRTDLSGSPRFRELLGNVRDVAMGAYAHQDLPFEKLVEELGESRDRSLFQIAFGLQNAHSESLELPGLEIGPAEEAEVVPRFDLTVWVIQGEEGLQVSWTYRTDVFPAAAIARLHGRYERLLRGAVERPDERIHRLDLLAASERAAREAGEREREKRQAQKLFNVRRRGVTLPRTEASAERMPEEGVDG
jgi:aspartate racemase